MRIVDLVPPGAVADDLRAGTKEEVLREMSALLAARVPGLSADALARVLSEREGLGSTGIGDGVAIPHGKIAGLKQLVVAVGRSRAGVPFQSLDGMPAHLFFLVAAPPDSAGLHLKALARISRLVKDARWREALLSARDAGEMTRLLREEDEGA